jgi:hypothetical protein
VVRSKRNNKFKKPVVALAAQLSGAQQAQQQVCVYF